MPLCELRGKRCYNFGHRCDDHHELTVDSVSSGPSLRFSSVFSATTATTTTTGAAAAATSTTAVAGSKQPLNTNDDRSNAVNDEHGGDVVKEEADVDGARSVEQQHQEVERAGRNLLRVLHHLPDGARPQETHRSRPPGT
jgi:hypothetical protein